MIKEENIRLIFGLKIKMLRRERGLSLSELAKLADVSVSYLNEIEKGKKYPKRDKIVSLAQALSSSYDQLVSLKISKKLAPLSDLLTSNILSDLPLDIFGIEPRNLLELMSDAPSKLSAFINTIVEISRNYDVSVESLYFSVLRSYQEMYDNYFEEIERAADAFREQYMKGLSGERLEDELRDYLERECGYTIEDLTLDLNKPLQHYRSVIRPEGEGRYRLMINSKLGERQRIFLFCREIGHHLLDLKERSLTYSWTRVNSFDELLNNYKASYFAGAALIPEHDLVEDMRAFLSSEYFESQTLLDMAQKYGGSSEMLLHRLTSILPRHFGLHKLFFLRLEHKPNTNTYKLSKEMHLDGLHSPHGTVLSEHYCRRWVSLKVFQAVEQQLQQQPDRAEVCQAQVSNYITSGNRYLCISIGRPSSLPSASNTSTTIGFLVEDPVAFREKVRFWNSDTVLQEYVNETCERCPSRDCQVRAADPVVLERRQREAEVQKALSEVLGGRS